MNVLLSIKPEFAEKIFDGTKNFEYRKTIFKRNDIEKVIVYSSSPVQMVIGEFFIEEIIQKKPFELWEVTKEFAGISEEFFTDYFKEKEHGFAIKISKRERYKYPKKLIEIYNNPPPQSFAYIE